MKLPAAFTVIPCGLDMGTPLSALPYFVACIVPSIQLAWMKLTWPQVRKYGHFVPCAACGHPAHTMISTVDRDGFWHPECYRISEGAPRKL